MQLPTKRYSHQDRVLGPGWQTQEAADMSAGSSVKLIPVMSALFLDVILFVATTSCCWC